MTSEMAHFRPRFALALVLALALLSPGASAAAQEVNAPPGNAGIDQYLETVPSSEGETPSGGVKTPQTGDQGPVLTPRQRRALAAQGPDGVAAATLAERYGVERSARGTGASTASGATVGRQVAPDDRGGGDVGPAESRSTLEAVAESLSPSGSAGGMGPALPVLLLITAALGVMGVVLRRRAS